MIIFLKINYPKCLFGILVDQTLHKNLKKTQSSIVLLSQIKIIGVVARIRFETFVFRRTVCVRPAVLDGFL